MSGVADPVTASAFMNLPVPSSHERMSHSNPFEQQAVTPFSEWVGATALYEHLTGKVRNDFIHKATLPVLTLATAAAVIALRPQSAFNSQNSLSFLYAALAASLFTENAGFSDRAFGTSAGSSPACRDTQSAQKDSAATDIPVYTPTVTVTTNPDQPGRLAAQRIADVICKNNALSQKTVLGLPTDETSRYRCMKRSARSTLIGPTSIRFSLNEYTGLAAGHPQSFRKTLETRFFDSCAYPQRKPTLLLDVHADDLDLAAQEYERPNP